MTEQNYQLMRRAMVSNQLRTTAVNDPRVVAAMGAVRRERHVPPENATLAYIDGVIPLGSGRGLNPPMATGRLLSEARPATGNRALVVGAATGYAAALLAELGCSVIGLESDAALLAIARKASSAPHITFVEGDLTKGWAKGAPYDLILIDGAVEQVPTVLIDQLAKNGKLTTGLLENGVTRLAIGQRAGTGFGLYAFADAEAAVLPGFEKPQSFSF